MFDPSLLLKTKKKPPVNNPPALSQDQIDDSIRSNTSYSPPTPEQVIQPLQPTPGPVEAEPPSSTPLHIRPRTVAPPMSDYEKTVAFGKDLQNNPNLGTGGVQLQKPPRWKAALIQALNGMGQGANRALEQGNVGWGGIAQALGAGAGGAVGGAVDPGIILRSRHQEAVNQNLNDQGRELDKLETTAKINKINADAEATGAQKSTLSERIVKKGEYEDIPEGTAIRVKYNGTTGQMEDLLPNGKPVISKAAPVKSVQAGGYTYQDDGTGNFRLPKGVPAPPAKLGRLVDQTDNNGEKVTLREQEDGSLKEVWRGTGPTKSDVENRKQYTTLNGLADAAKDRGNAHIQAAKNLDDKIADLKKKLAEEGPGTLQIDKDATEIARADAKDPATVKPVTKTVRLPVIPKDSPLRQQLQTELSTMITERQSHEKGMQDAFDEMEAFRIKAKPFEGSPPTSTPASDGKIHYTSAQIKASLKNNWTYDMAVKELTKNPNVVID